MMNLDFICFKISRVKIFFIFWIKYYVVDVCIWLVFVVLDIFG